MNPCAGHSLGVLGVTSQFDFCIWNPKACGRLLPSSLTRVKSELLLRETRQWYQNTDPLPLRTWHLGLFDLLPSPFSLCLLSFWVRLLPLTEKECSYVKRNVCICDKLLCALLGVRWFCREQQSGCHREGLLWNVLLCFAQWWQQKHQFNLSDSSHRSHKHFWNEVS